MEKIARRSGIIISLMAAGLLAGCQTTTNLQKGEDAGRIGDYKAMLQHCQKAAKEQNPDPQAFRCIGDAQLQLGNRSAAEAAYLTYLDSVPSDTDVRLELGKIYMDSGRIQAAQVQAEQAVKYAPTSYEAYYFLGEVYRATKTCKLARKAYDRALEINPDFYQAKAGLENLEQVCGKKHHKPRVKKEKVFKGGGAVLKESQW